MGRALADQPRPAAAPAGVPSLPSTASLGKGTPRRELSFDYVKLGSQYHSPRGPAARDVQRRPSQQPPQRDSTAAATAGKAAAGSPGGGRAGGGTGQGQRSKTAPRSRPGHTPGPRAGAAGHGRDSGADSAAAALEQPQLSPEPDFAATPARRPRCATPGVTQSQDLGTPTWHLQALLTLNDLQTTWDTVKRTPGRRTPGEGGGEGEGEGGGGGGGGLAGSGWQRLTPPGEGGGGGAALGLLALGRTQCPRLTAPSAAFAAARSKSAGRGASPELPCADDSTAFGFNISRGPLD
jgi:hypothetical protein